jgi:hypothetical protein
MPSITNTRHRALINKLKSIVPARQPQKNREPRPPVAAFYHGLPAADRLTPSSLESQKSPADRVDRAFQNGLRAACPWPPSDSGRTRHPAPGSAHLPCP